MLIPVELRFQPVEGRKLIESVAAVNKLKVTWARGDRYAVLYAGVPDADVAKVGELMASTTAPDRTKAAYTVWGWRTEDARAVPFLMKGARDANSGVSNPSRTCLGRATWEAVLALDETAWDVLAIGLKSPDEEPRRMALAAVLPAGLHRQGVVCPRRTDGRQGVERCDR